MTHQNPRPFLKWVGGKRQLIDQMERFFPLEFNNYVEPFVGGGAIFFWLFRCGKIRHNALLNDKNKELINCYRVVQSEVEELISCLKILEKKYFERKKTAEEEKYYYEIRAWDREKDFATKYSAVEKASRTIFLNKTGYNGLYRVNKKGHFNVPFGKYKNPTICDPDNLRSVAKALENVTITCGEFENCLSNVDENDLVYFDPPYHPLSESSSFTSYTSDQFDESDQVRVRDIMWEISEKGCFALLSNSYCDFILDEYQNFTVETLMAKRAINSDAEGRGEIKEVLIMNEKTSQCAREEKKSTQTDVLDFFKKVGRVTVRKKSNRC